LYGLGLGCDVAVYKLEIGFRHFLLPRVLRFSSEVMGFNCPRGIFACLGRTSQAAAAGFRYGFETILL
jgi:hypothetical protein